MMKLWIQEATEMFYAYRDEAKRSDIKELQLINYGKAVALSELLEKFGHKPDPDNSTPTE